MIETDKLVEARDEMREWRSHSGFESERLLRWANVIDEALTEYNAQPTQALRELVVRACMDRERFGESGDDKVSRIISEWQAAQPAQVAQPVGVPQAVKKAHAPFFRSPAERAAWAVGWNDCRDCMLAAAPKPAAQPSADAENDLPGMWSTSDFTGGDPDERSYAARTDAEDAARYRWLRDNPEHPSVPYFGDGRWYIPYQVSGAGGLGGGVGARPFGSLDAAIDAARAAEANGNGE